MKPASSEFIFASARCFFANLVTCLLLMNTGLAIGMAVGIAFASAYQHPGINESPMEELVFLGLPALGVFVSVLVSGRPKYFYFVLSAGIIGSSALLTGFCFIFVQDLGLGRALLLMAIASSVTIHGVTAVVFAIIMVVARFCWLYYRSRFINRTHDAAELR